VTLTRDQVTLALHVEGGNRSVRAAVGDDVRKLSVGDRTVFELSCNHATTAPAPDNPQLRPRGTDRPRPIAVSSAYPD
jgi:hypothetical protein